MVQDERIDLSERRLLVEALVLRQQCERVVRVVVEPSYLLGFRKLPQTLVHALLQNGDFLILLFTKALEVTIGTVELGQAIVNLDLLRLHGS